MVEPVGAVEPGQSGGLLMGGREGLEERGHPVAVEREVVAELPEDRTQRVAQHQETLAEEVGQPRLEVRFLFQRVERPVHLDGGEATESVRQLVARAQLLGVEIPAPGVVRPAGDMPIRIRPLSESMGQGEGQGQGPPLRGGCKNPRRRANPSTGTLLSGECDPSGSAGSPPFGGSPGSLSSPSATRPAASGAPGQGHRLRPVTSQPADSGSEPPGQQPRENRRFRRRRLRHRVSLSRRRLTIE